MSAPDTAQAADLPPLDPEPIAPVEPSAPCSAGEWLLAGGWFTVGLGGAITAWSKPAEKLWGLARHEAIGSPFVERLLAPAARDEHGAAIEAVLAGEGEGFSGEVGATASGGGTFSAAIAIVPIRTELGYELNDLLGDVTKQAKTVKALAALRQRHSGVLGRIEAALRGEGAVAAETEAGARLAGALVMFDPERTGAAEDDAPAPAPQPAPAAASVPAAGDPALPEATREALDAALRDALGARTEITGLQAQLEEARREAQRARNEAEAAAPGGQRGARRRGRRPRRGGTGAQAGGGRPKPAGRGARGHREHEDPRRGGAARDRGAPLAAPRGARERQRRGRPGGGAAGQGA